MAAFSEDPGYIVWGIDQTAYGPVDLPTLVAWVKDERVTAETWVFVGRARAWQKAIEIKELRMFLDLNAAGTERRAGLASPRGIEAQALRRIHVLANLSAAQLERFARFVEVEEITRETVVVKQGSPGDGMYFIIEGELRVRTRVTSQEVLIATLGVGECFGDIALFDHGPSSADVVANTDSVVVKLSNSAFEAPA
jgi:hypothetical protein